MGVSIAAKAAKYHQVHWFVYNKAQLDKELPKVLKLVTGDVVCWIYYPKGTSKIQTDLTRDKGWDQLLAHKDLTSISLITFDDTWSVFGFRYKTEKDRRKEVQPKQRAVLDYIDAGKRIIHLPDDLSSLIKKHRREADFFNTLSFTNRKEIATSVAEAKRPETRERRLAAAMARLGSQ